MKNLLGTKIKNQQVLITKIELEKNNLNAQKKTLQNEISIKEKQLKKHKEELEKLQLHSGTFIVSEHAIIRYLQRVYKLDLEKLENEILTTELKDKIKTYGSGSYNLDEFGIKVVDNVVVTIFDKISDEKQAHKKRPAKRSSEASKNKILDEESKKMLEEYS